MAPAILNPGLLRADHPLAGTESLGERAEIVTLSVKQGEISADMFNFEAGASSLLGTLTLPQTDLVGMQQLDAVCANLFGDHRDDMVIACSKELDPEEGSQLVLVVPAITDGVLDWNSDLTTTLEVPDFVLQDIINIPINPHRPVSEGYLRIIAGNFVAEEPGQPVYQEILVCGWVLPESRNASFKAKLFRVDADRNLHEISTALLDYDAWGWRCPFDVASGDLDGDDLDELILVRRHKDTSGADTAQIVACVFRLEEGAWVCKADNLFVSWTLGNLGGVYQNDVDHLAVAAGRFEAMSTQPLIAVGAGRRIWQSTGYPDFPTLRIMPELYLLEVTDATTETWQIVLRDDQSSLPYTTIYPDSYYAISPSLGISNGDLNFDGRDEIVLAGPDKLRVFGVTQDLQLNLLTEEPRPTTWDDASRRTVQVVDLDASAGNFVPEILCQEWLVSNPKTDLTPGLTAYWSFDHDFAADAGGTAFDALAHNSPQIENSGRFGSSVRIVRNQAQCLEVTTPVITPGQDHTYSVWHRATWGGNSQEDIPWHVIQSSPAYSISYYLRNWDGDGYDTRGSVDTQWAGGSTSRRFNQESFEDRWHNLIVTYDADAALHKIYMNGQLVTDMGSSTMLSVTTGLVIGGDRFLGNCFEGWIDDVAVWDRVLTESEIAAVQKQPVIPVDREYQVVVLQAELEPIQTDPDTLWAVTGLQGLDSWQGSAEFGNDFALVVGDFDGDSYRVGNYIHHQGVVATTPTVVLKAPPIHFDVLDGTVYDLAECYPGDCDFIATYHQETSSSATTKTTAKTSFGMGASLTVGGGWDWLGAKAEATVKTTYGEHFENSGWGNSDVSVGVEVTTWNQDRVHAAVMTYDVYEYEVLGEGEVIGHVAVTVPIQGDPTWYSTDLWLQLFSGKQSSSYPLDHEPGNILSYPADLGVGINDLLNSDEWGVSVDGSYTYEVRYSDVSGSSAGTTREFGLEMGSSVSGGGVEVELNASYSSSQMNMFSTEVSEDLEITVHFGPINNPNAPYYLHPMLYWSGGTLVVDYEVVPHTTFDQTSWWDLNYRDPDPAFILTHRYDEERYPAGGDPGVIKFITPDITLQPPFAAYGDSQRISAKVRNFSLEDLDQSLEVEFFLGDPDSVWSDGVLIGSAVVPPIAERGVQEVSIDWQVPPGTPDVARIWARINTDGLTEIHTNNNKGYGVLQSGGASAVYDPQVLPRPLTIRCVPNPFNPLTNFDFRIPRSGRTTLSIYDVTGRLVTRLVDEYLERGDHTRTWSGTDSNGRRLASGMYLYRIESGGYANTGKVIMLK
jgi:hypothetical protein